jgi:hypothetical protein
MSIERGSPTSPRPDHSLQGSDGPLKRQPIVANRTQRVLVRSNDAGHTVQGDNPRDLAHALSNSYANGE